MVMGSFPHFGSHGIVLFGHRDLDYTTHQIPKIPYHNHIIDDPLY
jgi:hypothetical protein